MQRLIIAGNVGRNAEFRQTQGGDPVLSFSLAVDNGKGKDGAKRESTWFDCSIWGKRAEALSGHITKGSKLALTGRPTAREHGGKVYLGITVDDLTFMGGGQSRDDAGGYSQRQDTQSDAGGYGGAGHGPRDLDDEIPF